jgi:hypothetical protein
VSFLNPLFLLGLVAAAIPVIIHLFTRRRPREQRFPSLEFLTEVNQSEIRRLRLKQWLLLLLRTLAVAALALALARPALRGAAGRGARAGGRTGAATTMVALVDVSGSMGAASPAGSGTATLAAQARRVVEDLLTTLGPADQLLLVPYDRAPRPLSARPSSDVGRLRAAAQALDAGAQSTDHRAALEFAARALAETRALNRELFWISDFQTAGFRTPASSSGTPSGYPGEVRDARVGAPAQAEAGGGAGSESGSAAGSFVAAPPGPWPQARVYLVPLAPRSRANVGLTDASLAPTESGLALTVSAVSFGASPGDLAVAAHDARTNDELARGFLNVPERGETSALLPLTRVPDEGGVVTLPDDPLPLDNRRAFAAGRSGTLRVVLREDGPPSALRLALEAGAPASGLEVETVGAAALPGRLAGADVLVVNDVERLGATETQAVLDFGRAGGGVLLVLGPHAEADFWNGTLLREAGLGTLGGSEEAAPDAAWRLMRTIAGHAVLAGFPARPGEPLTTARFRGIRALRAAPGARVLLEFDRAHPALVEGTRALAFAAGLDPESSDFPVSGAFLPLLHQAVKVLGRGTAAASLLPGERYSAPAATGMWRIEDEQGREVPSELVAAAAATRLLSAPLERPGLYRVVQGATVRSTFAVNPDARESDLSAVPEAALVRAFPAGRAQVVRPGAGLARRVREARFGRELWGWFVTLALALLVAESVVGRWGMAGAKAESETP